MTPARGRRTGRILGVLAWAGAVVLAGWIAWWAVAVIGGQARGQHEGVLTQEQVEAELAAASAAASTAPPTTPEPVPSPSASPSTSPPGGAQVVRTWTVTGGRVGASCTGERIELLFATPDEGWTVEATDPGPERVEVEFRRGESETGVHAECADGIPALLDSLDDD